MYSNRFSDDFFVKLKNMYENGLKSFVLKVSHLANSNGIYRIKDGKFIGANDTIDKNEMYGKMAYFSACYGVGKTRFFSRLGAKSFSGRKTGRLTE